MHLRTLLKATAGLAVGAMIVTGCSSNASSSGSSSGSGKVGLDQPRSDSDFWNAYAKYVPQKASSLGVDLMPVTNSENDNSKLVANVQALVAQGAKSIVIAPQDTGAVVSTVKSLNSKNIPIVTVDTRPDSGKVYMTVRADNKAYGTKACDFLGQQLKGNGAVVEFEGALNSINGRDRSQAFGDCMKAKFPNIAVYAEPTNWDGPTAAADLQTVMTQHPNVNGIYMQAGGVFLAPTLQELKSAGKLVPAGQPGHITIVSNDGIPQEYAAIRAGQIDATVSQPADLYAQYALFYAQAALQGKTFKPGRTDHNSTIVSWGDGNLEDQLPAPLVTKANVNDKSLWGNQIGQS
ncbi:MAG TPA: sugar ABC transporter substrate-binding protein [Pseudonocardiaceae bacterium]|jgi:simple sugar transport system substrate-binding protein/ribose transport system substrate-binding protein|nr:sugar ABC transporter substrate-binding protein [Pseudonocardiaceae bacterium]